MLLHIRFSFFAACRSPLKDVVLLDVVTGKKQQAINHYLDRNRINAREKQMSEVYQISGQHDLNGHQRKIFEKATAGIIGENHFSVHKVVEYG